MPKDVIGKLMLASLLASAVGALALRIFNPDRFAEFISRRGVSGPATIVGVLLLMGTMRALRLGGASAGGDGITREDEPLAYWTCVVAAAAAGVFLIWRSLRHG
jgi:hypothetical protein